MPLRDSNDIYQRFRASSSSPTPRPVVGADVKVGALPRFPIGASLPPRPQAAATVRRPVDVVAPQPARNRRRQPRVGSNIPPAAEVSTPQQDRAPQQAALPRKARARSLRRFFTRGRIALAGAVIILIAGGWFGFKVASNVQKVFHGSVFSLLSTTKLRGEDTGRINILLAGNSADDPGHDGANLTDSIMVISVDTKNNSAFMLSIPRDMWVNIPGYGHAKINEAYVDGENGKFSDANYFPRGMGLLQKVVDENFGIKADYYALVNYNALRDSVDAVGGIDITIQSENPRGLYDPSIDWGTHGPLVKLKNGLQHLDGRAALGLARARGDAYGSYGFPRSDFDRTEHQRQIILALKAKVLTANTLSNPVRIASLFDSIGKNVQTDFNLSEVRRIYDLSKSIPSESIASVGLNDVNGVNLLANYTSPVGQSALIPSAGLDDFSLIKRAITKLTTSDPLVREGAAVVVLNGTGTSGLAAQTQKLLTEKGITVAAIGDAKAPTPTTVIIDATSNTKPASLAKLKQIFGATATPTADNPYAATYKADFIIVIGSDWKAALAATPQQ